MTKFLTRNWEPVRAFPVFLDFLEVPELQTLYPQPQNCEP